MSDKHGKRYTPRFKFQVVMEILSGTKAIGQIARSYGVHPVTLTHWKEEFIEEPQIKIRSNPGPDRSHRRPPEPAIPFL